MKISVLWVGRTKEKFIKEAIKKYIKDIGTMANIETTEIKEAKGVFSEKRKPPAALFEEGGRIVKQAGDFVLLDETGEMMSSVEFAEFFRDKNSCRFVIGGPYGVSAQVKEAASGKLSLSRMTLPHELARGVLLEQIYRGLSIVKGRGYHHA